MHGMIIGLMDLSNSVANCGLYQTGSRYGPMAGFSEDVDELSGFIKKVTVGLAELLLSFKVESVLWS
jgi:hypothetical protein